MKFEVQRVRGHIDDAVAEIRANLGGWNVAHSRIAEEEEIALEVVGDRGERAGGLVAVVWGAVVEIDFLWVAEDVQRRGIGSSLVLEIERIARGLGCATATASTYSFQAPEFYLKLGYERKASVSGYPDGVSKQLLVKLL